MRHLITLDIGTSSMRAVIYSDDGSLLMGSGYEYHTTFPAPGQVEQDLLQAQAVAHQAIGRIVG